VQTQDLPFGRQFERSINSCARDDRMVSDDHIRGVKMMKSGRVERVEWTVDMTFGVILSPSRVGLVWVWSGSSECLDIRMWRVLRVHFRTELPRRFIKKDDKLAAEPT
jgi:hypothetical protein